MHEIILDSIKTIDIIVIILGISTVFFNHALGRKKNPLVKILGWIVNLPRQIKRHQQDKLTKRHLDKTISQLNVRTIETKLRAIHDLEQIAKNHPQYHWVIMEILSEFVRNNAPYYPNRGQASSNSFIKSDIQAAITVIGTRDTRQDPQDRQLDLSCTDMRGLDISGVNLEKGQPLSS